MAVDPICCTRSLTRRWRLTSLLKRAAAVGDGGRQPRSQKANKPRSQKAEKPESQHAEKPRSRKKQNSCRSRIRFWSSATDQMHSSVWGCRPLRRRTSRTSIRRLCVESTPPVLQCNGLRQTVLNLASSSGPWRHQGPSASAYFEDDERPHYVLQTS